MTAKNLIAAMGHGQSRNNIYKWTSEVVILQDKDGKDIVVYRAEYMIQRRHACMSCFADSSLLDYASVLQLVSNCYLSGNDLKWPVRGPFPFRWQEPTDPTHNMPGNFMISCTMKPPDGINDLQQYKVSRQ
jgi:hypothetical protein